MKINEMGGTCSTYGTQERCMQDFGGEILWEEIIWKPRHRWGIILKRIFKKGDWQAWSELIWLRIGTSGGCL
jgi:hypothetical protein